MESWTEAEVRTSDNGLVVLTAERPTVVPTTLTVNTRPQPVCTVGVPLCQRDLR